MCVAFNPDLVSKVAHRPRHYSSGEETERTPTYLEACQNSTPQNAGLRRRRFS